MFLDELPSATKYDGKDHYDENIPLGYMADHQHEDAPLSQDGQEEMQIPMIFNHLDIVVTVHETELSKRAGTYEQGSKTTISFAGRSFNATVPQKSVRIVGFEVTP